MASERNRIALENNINYYLNAKAANAKVVQLVKSLKNVDDDGKHAIVDDIKISLKDLIKFTNKISITIMERTYPGETSEQVNKNVERFKHNILHVEKLLLGKEFLDAAIYNLEVLVNKAAIKRYEYYPFAKNEKDLAYKIGLILTDPKYIDEYKSILSKISGNRISIDEFVKLFFSIKDKLPSVQDETNESFVSFNMFKKKLTNGI